MFVNSVREALKSVILKEIRVDPEQKSTIFKNRETQK